MSIATKFISALSLGGAILLATTGTAAHAFSIIAPATETHAEAQEAQYRTSPEAAFAAGAGEASALNNSLLSPEMVRHVQWCARRYQSYHATDNTFASQSGVREECRSPY